MKDNLEILRKQIEQAARMQQQSQVLAKKAIDALPESAEKARLISLQQVLANCKGDAVKIQEVINELTNML